MTTNDTIKEYLALDRELSRAMADHEAAVGRNDQAAIDRLEAAIEDLVQRKRDIHDPDRSQLRREMGRES